MNLKTNNGFSNCEKDMVYAQELVEKGLIPEGCLYCMTNGGCCSLEDAVRLSNDEWIRCTPMSYIPENLEYPVGCIRDWFGDNYIEDNCQD